jgi:hypothetical protein
LTVPRYAPGYEPSNPDRLRLVRERTLVHGKVLRPTFADLMHISLPRQDAHPARQDATGGPKPAPSVGRKGGA